MKEARLPLPPFAYRFSLLLEFVKRIAYPARLVVQGDTLWRFTAGELIAYRQEGDAVVLQGEGLSHANEERIKRISCHCLGLERDLTTFYDFAARDPALWQVVAPLVGFPIFCSETVFEALITLIIEQHISWKNALRYQRTLMRMFDSGAAIGRAAVYRFPSPQQLARASQSQLKALKITNRRIDLIIEIANAVASGALDLASIGDIEAGAAYDRLMKLNGVGHWTANNVIGRALGVYPFVSQNDVALQAAVQLYFHAGKGQKSPDQVRETLGRYREYAGLAGHFVLLRWVLERYPPVSP
ncbi:MAG: hypothetical protein OXG53_15215 [Chloroflexi bacterium]|nr:hypothetical protein [Chloroflexota bacterium]